ncbi:MAG TPA: hypothetical protein VI006_12445 [Solirubrobacteraceae bacterium]
MLQEAYRLAMAPVSTAVGVGRWVRDMSLDLAGDAALSGLDALLASPRADEAADRILTSPLAEHAVARALDRAVADGVPQRIADRLLEDGLAEQLAQRFLDGPELERMVALVLESERVDAALASALESADMERLITRILESRLIEETVTRLVDETAARLPESQALWALVDEVAQSPAVTDAITQQGLGLADEVAGEVRDRSRAADAWLERAARRMLRRRTPDGGMSEPFVP